MPLYEYQCQQCHKRFEVLQKLNARPLDKCPECGGSLCRLVSSPAIQFKGSGWYITDYAHKNSPAGGNGQNGRQKAERENKPDEKPADRTADKAPEK